MPEFNIGKTIQEKRKHTNLTQEELAKIMGVSKSSVSKWETGQTYPDICLLPKLATFFYISIDDLMGYEPELKKVEIKAYYLEYSQRFANEPFERVFQDYDQLIKKYYANESFLSQMAVLLLNYIDFSTEDRQQDLLKYLIDLVQRIKRESKETFLIAQANSIEAFCQLQLGEIDETLRLLNRELSAYMGDEQLLARAYAAKGDVIKAQEVLQVSQFQHLLGVIVTSGDSLFYEIAHPKRFDQIVERVTKLMLIYDLRQLHPMLMLTFFNNIFIGYTEQNRLEKALETLEKIVELMLEQVFPIELHGDGYFNLLGEWIEKQIDINTNMPRDEKTIKNSLITFYETNPSIVTSFEDNERFQNLLQQLKENRGDMS